jgi:ribonuclease T2
VIRWAAALVVMLAAGTSLGAREIRGVAPGDFDLYRFSLTWSSDFCASGGSAKQPDQCDAGSQLGFPVHGLWPQGERDFPAECNRGAFVRWSNRDTIHGVLPFKALARYELKKRGTSLGLAPSRYFAAISALYSKTVIPRPFRARLRDVRAAPLGIERAFAEANPGLRPDVTAISCARCEHALVLTKIRICVSKDLRVYQAACPETVQRQGGLACGILIPALR